MTHDPDMIPTLQKGQVGRYILRPVLPTNVCADGPGWTETTIPNSERMTCIVYGNGLYVAGGIRIGTPSIPCAAWSDDDGVTWTESTTVFNDEYSYGFGPLCMAYGGGVWLASLYSGTGLKSTDGKTWSKIANPSYMAQFTYCTTNFVATRYGISNVCYVTDDGTSFSAKTLPSTETWLVCEANGDTVIVLDGVAGKSAISSDAGLNWAAGGTLPFNVPWTLAYGNGTWVATNSVADTKVAYSTDDGANWQYSNLIDSGGPIFRRVRFYQGRFVVVSDGGGNDYNSADGITWNAIGDNINMGSFLIDFDGDDLGSYAAVGNAGSNTTVANYGICAG